MEKLFISRKEKGIDLENSRLKTVLQSVTLGV